MRTRRRIEGVLVSLVMTACSAGSLAPPETDARVEVDAGGEVGVDAGPDAGPGCTPGPFLSGVSTLAGCDDAGMVDGERAQARFHNPVNVARGPDGRLYVADFDNGRIRAVDDLGRTTTLVEREGFARPFGLAFAPDGRLYITTDANPQGERSATTGTIWVVDPDDGGTLEVVAHDIGRPRGLLALDDGRIVVSDYQHHTLRVLTPSTGTLVALAGGFDQPGAIDAVGAAARFRAPVGLARLADGRIAVADMENHVLRAVTPEGEVTTLAGTGTSGQLDGAVESARFARPQGLAATASGDLYVTDTDNFVVRRVSEGQVTTVVGSGAPGSRDSEDLLDAEVFGLEGLAVAGDGTRLWIADGSRGEDVPHHRVRVVALP